jgi:hypothetical protein
VTEERLCIACAKPLPESARLCPSCGSHQAAWRNEIGFVATVTGVASVSVTAVAFLISILPDVRTVVAWRDAVEVLSYDAGGDVVLANSGDGEVYVSDIRVEFPGFVTIRPINRTIRAGEVISDAPDEYDAILREYRVSEPGQTFAADVRAARAWAGRPCQTLIPLTSSSPPLRMWTGALREVPLGPAPTATIRYYSAPSGRTIDEPVDLVSVLARHRDC